jgi:hypothetical protein
MLIEHLSLIFIIPILFAFLLSFIEISSARAIQKHGAKIMPRQVIYPTVWLWKDNWVDPFEMNDPLQKPSKRH